MSSDASSESSPRESTTPSAKGTHATVPSGPQLIRPGCWMVGRRNPLSLLQCNTYIRSFENGDSSTHICVDPGSQYDFAEVQANINQLLGDLGEIQSFSLNHQDPDVVGNAIYLCEANPNISALVTEEVWRLVQHLLIKPARIHFANAARSDMTTIGDRSRWQLVPTPFCHFRGAMAFYDPELRTLFSGDLFGGLNQMGRVHLTAQESDWAGIAQFHQIYMPTREALRYAVRQIRALTPAVEVIAPQHGHIITGDLVPLFLERMHELVVGFELVAMEIDETHLNGYREVIEQLLNLAGEAMGMDEVVSRLRSDEPGDGLGRLIKIQGNEVTVDRGGYSAVVKILSRLSSRESLEFVNQMRSLVLTVCSELGIPIPPVGAGVEEGSTTSRHIGPDGIRTNAWWLS